MKIWVKFVHGLIKLQKKPPPPFFKFWLRDCASERQLRCFDKSVATLNINSSVTRTVKVGSQIKVTSELKWLQFKLNSVLRYLPNTECGTCK